MTHRVIYETHDPSSGGRRGTGQRPNSRETIPFDAEMGELPGKMNRFAALLIAVLVLPSPALAEQKRPLVLIDDAVAPLPSTDTTGTPPRSEESRAGPEGGA